MITTSNDEGAAMKEAGRRGARKIVGDFSVVAGASIGTAATEGLVAMVLYGENHRGKPEAIASVVLHPDVARTIADRLLETAHAVQRSGD